MLNNALATTVDDGGTFRVETLLCTVLLLGKITVRREDGGGLPKTI